MITPDRWCVIKISGITPHYRVFASFNGGFLDGDSWKVNSGIVGVKEDEDWYFFYGHSGSCYKCNKSERAYGASIYGSIALERYTALDLVELLDNADWTKIDWIIREK
jgi:hypothetical protein